MSLLNVIKKIARGEQILTVKQSQAHWDKQFSKGKWDFLIRDAAQQGHAAVIGLLCRELAKGKEIRVLDVGCGNGLLTDMVKKMCPSSHYVGLDISQIALDVLKKNHPDAVLFCADADTPPDFKEKFDVIIFCEVLLYLDFERTLEKYKKYLAPDGTYIISLYDTWRTRLIWMKMNKHVRHLLDYKVVNKQRRITWNIALVEYKDGFYSKHEKTG